MVAISFTQLRQNAKTYFDAVEKGEIVRVLRHGKIIAEIIPAHTKKTSKKKTSPPLIIPGASLSQAILKERKQSNF